MPRTHTRNFRIRYYECDANGHLNNANYLRYMQETAFDASTATGFDSLRYQQMGKHWLIRASQIEFLQPLRYNQQILVKTWVSDFRSVTSRRQYEFCFSDTGEKAAAAYTDWVFLDSDSGNPAAIPHELEIAFFPEGLPDDFPARHRIPRQPPPPAGTFKLQRRVEWLDLDQMQHVNNAVYLDYINECGMQVIKAFNWPWERMKESGFAIFIRRLQVKYLEPAVENDLLEIATWASNVRRSFAERHYTIRRASDNTLLVEANTMGVWVDLETNRPIRIPDCLLEDFSPNIV